MSLTENDTPSTRPYLIRALHEWCSDNGYSPYVAVQVDGTVQVPLEFVKNGEIVLNVGFDATSGLQLGNEFIEFKARFGGVARDIVVPISHVVAIYARENGQGMAFPAPAPAAPPGLPDADNDVVLGPTIVATSETRERAALRSVPSDTPTDESSHGDDKGPPPEGPPQGGRPRLRRVK
jgi:stringent starvation protein B